MKKITAIILILSLCCGILTACFDDSENSTEQDPSSAEISSSVSETESETKTKNETESTSNFNAFEATYEELVKIFYDGSTLKDAIEVLGEPDRELTPSSYSLDYQWDLKNGSKIITYFEIENYEELLENNEYDKIQELSLSAKCMSAILIDGITNTGRLIYQTEAYETYTEEDEVYETYED